VYGGVEAMCTRRGRRRMKNVWRCGGCVHNVRLHLGQRFQGCKPQGICFIGVRFGCRGFGGAVR